MRTAALIAAEFAIIAYVWFAMDALLHLRLSLHEFFLTLVVGWFLPRGLAWGLWKVWRWSERMMMAVGVAATLLALCVVNLAVSPRLSFGLIGYTTVLVEVLLYGWRWTLDAAESVGARRIPEVVRRLWVGAAAAWATFGFATDRFVGGVDARWYSYMLGDFLAQARAGVFPIFLGQGELAYNGAAHPFRSAPIYLWLGGIVDLITCRVLPLFAMQHLVAMVAGFVSAFGLYAVMARLAPARRWPAAGIAALYVTCPGSLAIIYCGDMYMTYIALAALPLLLYGNVRSVDSGDSTGYWALAAGLALVWMCHPPVAILATCVTLFVQLGRLLFATTSTGHWREMIRGAVLCLGLSVYYFYSMAELPPRPGASLAKDGLLLAGIILSVAAVAQGVVWRRRWWLGLLVPAAFLLWKTKAPWLWWLAVFVPLSALFAWIAGRARLATRLTRGVDGVFCAAIAAMAIAAALLGRELPGHDLATIFQLKKHMANPGGFFLPISPAADRMTDFQPGLALWVLFGVAMIVATVRAELSGKLLVAAGVLLVLMLVPVPLLSSFWVGYTPPGIAAVVGLPLPLRLLPVIAAVACVATFVVLFGRTNTRWVNALLMTLLVAGVAWSSWEARRFVQRGRRSTASEQTSAALARSENIQLHRFAYDLLNIPDYFSEGKLDARLEHRVLRLDHSLQVDPDQIARKMEADGVRVLSLHSRPHPSAPDNWLKLSPAITLTPGEHVLLRFEFGPEAYAGYLIFTSDTGAYREYKLPRSGMPKSFGTDPAVTKVLSFWNSGSKRETYEITVLREPEHEAGVPEGEFGTVHVSHYDPERSPIQVESWTPYRLKVVIDEPGFVETPRVFLPGYVARVNGVETPVIKSPQRLVMVPVEAGEHIVELSYVGTWKLRLAALISGLSWLGFLGAIAAKSPRIRLKAVAMYHTTSRPVAGAFGAWEQRWSTAHSVSPPQKGSDRRQRIWSIALCGVLLVSLGLRIALVVRGGQQFWPDEDRYIVSRDVVHLWSSEEWSAGVRLLFGSIDGLFFKIVGLFPAVLEQSGCSQKVSAAFFALPSVATIFLVWRIGLRLSGRPREAFLAALLAATANSLFYFSRHFLPYDFALWFGLIAWLVALKKPGPLRSWITGVCMSLVFLTYSGYWMLSATLLIAHILSSPRSASVIARRAGWAVLGVVTPLMGAIGGAAMTGVDFASFFRFSTTNHIEEFGAGWRTLLEYFFSAEKTVIWFWTGAVLLTLHGLVRSRRTSYVVLPIAITAVLGGGMVFFSDIMERVPVYGHMARMLVPFVCLTSAFAFDRLIAVGGRARFLAGLAIFAIIALGAVNFIDPLRQVFPNEFRTMAREETDARRRAGERDAVHVLHAGFLRDSRDIVSLAALPPHEVILTRPHPVEFKPYLFEGYDERQRWKFQHAEIAMRLVIEGEWRVWAHRAKAEGRALTRPYPGAIRMIVRLPKTAAQSEPLVVTGEPGRGNILYVIYDSDTSIRLGFDHWGVGGAISQPISVTRGWPVKLELSIGSLFPPANANTDPQAQWRTRLFARVDDTPIWSQRAEFYPAEASSIVFGINPIGGSTTGAKFSGEILELTSLEEEELRSYLSSTAPLAP